MEKLSHSELMQQSLEEATFYMTSAIEIINDKFNDSSYAENHPELLGAFMQTAAIANLESVLLNELGNRKSDRSDTVNHSLIKFILGQISDTTAD